MSITLLGILRSSILLIWPRPNHFSLFFSIRLVYPPSWALLWCVHLWLFILLLSVPNIAIYQIF
jgi:hypothetical protein